MYEQSDIFGDVDTRAYIPNLKEYRRLVGLCYLLAYDNPRSTSTLKSACSLSQKLGTATVYKHLKGCDFWLAWEDAYTHLEAEEKYALRQAGKQV